MTTLRILFAILAVLVGFLVVANLPDINRYLKIRRM